MKKSIWKKIVSFVLVTALIVGAVHFGNTKALAETFSHDEKINNDTLFTLEGSVDSADANATDVTLNFKVTDKDIEHLVDDALHRAKGVLYISDLPVLPDYFAKAVFVKTEKETKKHERGVFFHYYQIEINGRTLFLNFREDRPRHRTNLHSITIEIREAIL